MILKPRGASAQVATHSHLPRGVIAWGSGLITQNANFCSDSVQSFRAHSQVAIIEMGGG